MVTVPTTHPVGITWDKLSRARYLAGDKSGRTRQGPPYEDTGECIYIFLALLLPKLKKKKGGKHTTC